MDRELQKTMLHVAIVANTLKDAEYYYSKFVNDNRENILIPGRNKSVMNDGTIVEKISLSTPEHLKSMYLDQVIPCLYEYNPYWRDIKWILAAKSQVPEEFWLLYVDDENW